MMNGLMFASWLTTKILLTLNEENQPQQLLQACFSLRKFLNPIELFLFIAHQIKMKSENIVSLYKCWSTLGGCRKNHYVSKLVFIILRFIEERINYE